MWDEENFIRDFKKESEQIKPDDELAQRIKETMHQESIKKTSIPVKRYAAIAASFLICLIVGSVIWNVGNYTNNDQEKMDNSHKPETHAGKKRSDTQYKVAKPVLEKVIVYLNGEESKLKDENGKEISISERERLLEILKNAKKTEEAIDKNKMYTNYFCADMNNLEIRVYENEYIIFGDSDTVYKVE